MIVLHCCQYVAPYEGNFIKSLVALESKIKEENGETIYVFPEHVLVQPWWPAFSNGRKVYTTSNDVRNSYEEIRLIVLQEKPHIIHSHFDGYDIPIAKCLEQTKYSVHVIWHLHNFLSFHRNPIKAFYQIFCFFHHYFFWGRNVHIISVCEETFNFVYRFRAILGRGFRSWAIIPNGIDLSRVSSVNDYSRHTPVSFLAFGGRNDDKRIDLILNASSIISLHHSIRLYVTNGVDTQNVLYKHFGNILPDWCVLLNQNSNVCELFSVADCFVSSSVHETFSYGICEASIFGLPVIQSDISGTLWNAKNPSTFLFKSENVNDLCRAMLDMIQMDAEKLKKACIETQKRNRESYSLEKWSENIMDFYQAL